MISFEWFLTFLSTKYYLAVVLFNKVKQVLDDLNLLLNDIYSQLYDNIAVMRDLSKAFFRKIK